MTPTGAQSQPSPETGKAQALAASPFRGIESFRFADRDIFFAREDETTKLLRYVTIYRGVLLYGDSGSGKSSLVGAGLIRAALEEDFAPELLRVQPSSAAAVKVERITVAEEGPARYLPTIFADDQQTAPVFLSVGDFRARLGRLPRGTRPLLIFDQFEELFTLFDSAPTGDLLTEARTTQAALFDVLVELMRDQSLPIKLLFVFREDFLAKFTGFFRLCPDLPDHYIHLTAPRIEKLSRIVRGPFEKFAGRFDPELPVSLVDKVVAAFRERNPSGNLSLSEVQIACERLWRSEDRDALLARKGIQGLLEDYLSEAITTLPAEVRDVAILVLTRMVTDLGTRNVVSEYDLISWIREHEGIPDVTVRRALEALERSARLIRREPRHDVYFYEIISEFLVPWILRQKSGRETERKIREERTATQARVRRRIRRLAVGFASLLFAFLLLAVFFIIVFQMKENAEEAEAEALRQEEIAHGHQLAREAVARAPQRLDLALLLGLEVGRKLDKVEARKALIGALANGPNIYGFVREHKEQVSGLEFNREGTLMASAGFDGAVYVWQTATWELDRSPLRKPGADPIYSIRFSPDGNHLAAASDDGAVLVWDLKTDAEPARLKGHEGAVREIAFSSDGKLLASAGVDGNVIVWNVPLGSKLRLLHHQNKVYAVAFGRGSTLVSAGESGTIILWDATSGVERGRVDAQQANILTLAVSPDGTMLAAGYGNGRVELRAIATLKRSRELLPSHTNAVDRVTFSADGKNLASTGRDRNVMVWNVKTRKKNDYSLTGYSSEVYGLSFAPSGTILASGSADGTIVLWNLAGSSTDGSKQPERGGLGMEAGFLATTLALAPSDVDDVAFSPNGRALMVATSTGVKQWDTATFESKPIGKKTNALTVAFRADGELAAAAGCAERGPTLLSCKTGEIQFLNPITGQPVRDPIKVHTDWIFDLAFSKDGKLLASGSWDGEVRLWDASTLQPLGTPLNVGTRVNHLAFSSDNRLLATTTEDDVIIWDVSTRQRQKSLSEFAQGQREIQIDTVVFNPKPENGNILAIGGSSSDIFVWDIGTGTVNRLEKHRARINALAFSPDGSILASGSDDNEVVVWDVQSGEPFVPLTGFTSRVTSLAFDPDGNRLAIAGRDGPLIIWDIGYNSLRRRACQIAGRNLTLAEWSRFMRDEPQQISCGYPLVKDANRYATFGQRAEAKASFSEAVRVANAAKDDQLANHVCWNGALNGFAELVLPTCTLAVESAPEVVRGMYFDSRGLARALTGDTRGALDDFKTFLTWAAEGRTFEPHRQKRRAWVFALEKGQNPFDAATLRSLRTE